MEHVADAASAAGKTTFALAGCILVRIRGQRHRHRVGAAERLRMINGHVSRLDCPEQHREHDCDQTADQTNGFRILSRRQTYTDFIARR